MSKRFYIFDEVTGAFIDFYDAQESPLEPGVYICPTSSTEIEPPGQVDGKLIKWINGKWSYEDIPEPEAIEEPYQPTEKELRIIEIDAELQSNDMKMIRPSAAIAAATVAGMDVMDSDKNRLMELMDANETLRAERRTLTGG